jgi:hypothetical protein
MAVLMLIKGSKSLQLSMNDFLPKLRREYTTADKSAYSKARRKLKHTAFIELNREAVVRTMYEGGPDDYLTLHGFRILAVDGSKVQLPTNTETEEVFGSFDYHSMQPDGKGPAVSGRHSYGLASVLYDVLNRVALDAILAPSHSYEVELAKDHLIHTETNGQFLVRCTRRSFKVAKDMLEGTGPDDVTVDLIPGKKFLQNLDNKDLPQTLTVRFIRVTLDSGEYEVLATSLLDHQKYPITIFKELYYCRWGIETFYGILRTRLGLENFSGYSPESILQDFHAAVLLTGAETILTEDAEAQLSKQRGGHPRKVNKAVSFNLIKERAFELFYSKAPDEQRLEALTKLFMSSPTLIRTDRKPPRSQSASHKILGFWKHKRKIVF